MPAVAGAFNVGASNPHADIHKLMPNRHTCQQVYTALPYSLRLPMCNKIDILFEFADLALAHECAFQRRQISIGNVAELLTMAGIGQTGGCLTA